MKYLVQLCVILFQTYGKLLADLGVRIGFLSENLTKLWSAIEKIPQAGENFEAGVSHLISAMVCFKRGVKAVEKAVKGGETTPEVRALQESLVMIKSLMEGIDSSIDNDAVKKAVDGPMEAWKKSFLATPEGRELVASYPVVIFDEELAAKLATKSASYLQWVLEDFEKEGYTNVLGDVTFFNEGTGQLEALQNIYQDVLAKERAADEAYMESFKRPLNVQEISKLSDALNSAVGSKYQD